MSDTPEPTEPPGPHAPPRVPGHMGYPRREVVDAAHAVFGMLDMLEEMGVDVEATRRYWKGQAESIGLRIREADLARGAKAAELRRDGWRAYPFGREDKS